MKRGGHREPKYRDVHCLAWVSQESVSIGYINTLDTLDMDVMGRGG